MLVTLVARGAALYCPQHTQGAFVCSFREEGSPGVRKRPVLINCPLQQLCVGLTLAVVVAEVTVGAGDLVGLVRSPAAPCGQHAWRAASRAELLIRQ